MNVFTMRNSLCELATQWFATTARDLPWRRPDCTPWGVLVSEVMLQQTPVARVQPVWEHWMRRWPSPSDLAAAETGDVLRAWDRLGYPRRALRLQQCAAAIVRDHGGLVPESETTLRSLPGIGEYTAAAVAGFAFGHRSLVVDVNVRRVEARAAAGLAHAAKNYSAVERELAAALLPEEPAVAVQWNAAIMEIGALVCTARKAHCQRCPLASACAWYQGGQPDNAPRPVSTQKWVGTDRQMRGAIMGHLRNADGPLARDDLRRLTLNGLAEEHPTAQRTAREAQFEVCLDSLAADGLCTLVRSPGALERVALPAG
ncbi:A/G-specific adenine glycosylase [Micrococcales bacterium 31B]|nr:A/G-specific adenine glycosylase [Micrococcales bacterium 31B]